jgi:hypothetical protein
MQTFIQEVIPDDYISLIEKVDERLSKEMKFFVQSLESSLPSQGRCLICTLKLPCKHIQKAPESSFLQIKKQSYWKVHSRELSVPVTSLEKLEKIEKFRENRISQDLESLQKIREKEEESRVQALMLEKKRTRHAQKQKKKLEEYKTKIEQIKKKIIEKNEGLENLKKVEEQKFKEYLLVQKRKLMQKADQNKCSVGFFKKFQEIGTENNQ